MNQQGSKAERELIAKKISSLADPQELMGQIRFIHKDGKEHLFYSVVNIMSGTRLSGFDDDPPSMDDSLAWVRSVFHDIRTKATVIEVLGDF
jgi:hypothetical protein